MKWAVLAAPVVLAGLAACQDTGLPLNGQIQAAYVMPACLIFCTAHLAKEDASAVGSGSLTTGGIASSSASQIGGN